MPAVDKQGHLTRVFGVIITLSDLTLFISCDDKSIEIVDN